MTRMLMLCATSVLLLASAVCVSADIARPKPAASPAPGRIVFHTGLTIVPDSKAYEARLQISQESLHYLREALASVPSDPSLMQRLAHSSTRTIMAGVFLFLSVSFAGVLLARSGQRRSHKAIAAILLGAAVLGAAAIVTRANAGPPGYVRWQGLPQALTEGRATQGGLDIEIVLEGNGMKLIVPMRNIKKPTGEE